MRVVSYTRTTSCLPHAETPSNVIKIQNDHILAYAKEKGLKICKTYSDRKNDPEAKEGFDQMLHDGMARQFDMVITDSLRRCGRNLFEAKEVLSQTFFCAGIHFAVVEDDFCSQGRTREEIEAYFTKEHGKFNIDKLRSLVNTRNQKGILSWSDAKYGYKLTEDYQMVPDERTAPVVKRIFELCAGGMHVSEVAALLSSEKIPNPASMRENYKDPEDPYKWTRNGVALIIRKTVYMGHWTKVVQGKELHFTNEPLVSEEVYQKAQAARNSPTYQIPKLGEKHRYHGILCDVKYGFCLVYRKNSEGKEYFRMNSKERMKDCSVKQMLAGLLDQAVLEKIAVARKLAEKLAVQIQANGTSIIAQRLQQLEVELKEKVLLLAESEAHKMEIYQNYQESIISKDEYEKALKAAKSVVQSVEEFISYEKEQRDIIQTAFSLKNPWIELFLHVPDTDQVDRELLTKYVSVIETENLQMKRIVLKEEKWLSMLPEDWRLGNGEKE